MTTKITPQIIATICNACDTEYPEGNRICDWCGAETIAVCAFDHIPAEFRGTRRAADRPVEVYEDEAFPVAPPALRKAARVLVHAMGITLALAALILCGNVYRHYVSHTDRQVAAMAQSAWPSN